MAPWQTQINQEKIHSLMRRIQSKMKMLPLTFHCPPCLSDFAIYDLQKLAFTKLHTKHLQYPHSLTNSRMSSQSTMFSTYIHTYYLSTIFVTVLTFRWWKRKRHSQQVRDYIASLHEHLQNLQRESNVDHDFDSDWSNSSESNIYASIPSLFYDETPM